MIWGESYIKPKDRYLIVILKTLFPACWSRVVGPINHLDKGHWNQISIKICSIMSLICFSSINFFPSILHPINQICCSACNSLWRRGLWFYEVNAAEPFHLHRLKFYVCWSFLLFSLGKNSLGYKPICCWCCLLISVCVCTNTIYGEIAWPYLQRWLLKKTCVY